MADEKIINEELRYYLVEYKGEIHPMAVSVPDVESMLLGESRLDRQLIDVLYLNTLHGVLIYNRWKGKYQYKFIWDKDGAQSFVNSNLSQIAIHNKVYIIDMENKTNIAAEDITEIKEITNSIIIGNSSMAEYMLLESMEKMRDVAK